MTTISSKEYSGIIKVIRFKIQDVKLNYYRSFIFYLLLYNSTNCIAQQFSAVLCNQYYSNYQDSLLFDHLTNSSNSLKSLQEKALYSYFLGLYNRFNGSQLDQLEALYDSQSFAKKIDYDSLLIHVYNELAIVLRSGGSEEKLQALEFINNSIQLQKKNNSGTLAKSHLIKGNIYAEIKDGQDSAIFYYQKVIKNSLSKANVRLATKNLGIILIEQRKYNSAEKIFSKILNEEIKEQLHYDQIHTLNNLVSIYNKTGNYKKSKKILDSLIYISSIYNYSDQLYSAITNQAEYCDSMRDFQKSSFWKDSIFNLQHEMMDIQNRSAFEKYKSMSLKNQRDEEKSLRLQNQLWLSIISTLAVFLGFLVFGIFRYQTIRRKEIKLELEHTKTKAAFDATKAKMAGEQKERQTIATTLHDQVASMLTAADIHMKIASKNHKSEALQKANNIVKEVSQQVRNLSHQLVSPTLLKFGLIPALDSLCSQRHNENITCYFQSEIEILRFDSKIELFLYQSCGELIQNVFKHSNAQHIKVSLAYFDNELILTVFEDGQSNSKLKSQKKPGLGLIQIRNKASAYGGSFTMEHSKLGLKSILKLPTQTIQ